MARRAGGKPTKQPAATKRRIQRLQMGGFANPFGGSADYSREHGAGASATSGSAGFARGGMVGTTKRKKRV
jgi:hypothetical protein